MVKKTDQRTRLTQYLIRKSLTELLQTKPIQSITIKELCDTAGINRGTFYAHYEDIYDLLHRMEEQMMADFQEALAPLLQCSEEDFSAFKITAGIFNCIKDNADLCSVTLGPYGDKEFAARLLAVGRERCLVSYRKFFERASPKQIEYYYAFVSAGCIGLLEKWMLDGMTASAEDVAKMAEGIMVSGVHYLQQP